MVLVMLVSPLRAVLNTFRRQKRLSSLRATKSHPSTAPSTVNMWLCRLPVKHHCHDSTGSAVAMMTSGLEWGLSVLLNPSLYLQHTFNLSYCWHNAVTGNLSLLQLFEAKASLSLAQTQHALQLQQAKAQMNNMVPRKQFEQLQASLREEQCKVQQLQANLQQQAEQACRQLVRIQVSRELQEFYQGYQRGGTTSLEWSFGQGHQKIGWKIPYLKNAIDLQIPAAVFIPHESCHHPVLDQEYTLLLFIYLRPSTSSTRCLVPRGQEPFRETLCVGLDCGKKA